MLVTADGLLPISERLSPKVYKLLKVAAEALPPVKSKTENVASATRIFIIGSPILLMADNRIVQRTASA